MAREYKVCGDESADQLRTRQLRHWSTVLACLNRVGGQYSAQDTPEKRFGQAMKDEAKGTSSKRKVA